MSAPSRAADGFVVGYPSLSIAQPSGIGVPRRSATSILPRGTVDVAMSRLNAGRWPAGAAMAIGFVPMSPTLERVGATIPVVFVIEIPIIPAAAACNAYHPAIPKWFALCDDARAIPVDRAVSMAQSIAILPA